ncbi:MAG: hypothetical protein D6714_05790 [Bacteroidetes bacterium]|nr:MAG: hypothetical protein D6714_05790 [Bacteroidota bacterium]
MYYTPGPFGFGVHTSKQNQMGTERKLYSREDVIAKESEHLIERRKRLFGEEAAKKFHENKFGIALSGGGIRSATINLGFLKTLNLFNVVRKADYLSTVSGGGYTGSYIQATLKSKGSYDALFEEKRIEHLRKYGNYLTPGQKLLQKRWNGLLVVVGYLGSFLMSLLNLAIVVGMFGVIYYVLSEMLDAGGRPFLENYAENKKIVYQYGLPILAGVVGLHFIVNVAWIFNLKLSKYFIKIETALIVLAAICFAVIFLISFDEIHTLNPKVYLTGLAIFVGLFLLGFITNPNGVSFHRFYRTQLAEAFLHDTGDCENLPLKELSKLTDEEKDYFAPYPLINTCLNIQSPEGDDKIKGAKASDYFLLSPLFCGAKLTKYVETANFPGYQEMTLPAATTISAAAVNPGMGIYSSSLLSFFMTLFNARLGFWVNNPLKKDTNYWVWWPTYFFKELLANINTKLKKVNISDGGHIENLAVYELLRRRCRLIIAVDAGADPDYAFTDLENLTVRARNELGVDIAFRKEHIPEQCIRPKPSSGYSDRRFSIADLFLIWEEFELENEDGTKVLVGGCPVEVLVNYTMVEGELKFKADLKLVAGKDVTHEAFAEMEKLAARQVQKKLDAKQQERGRDKVKFGTLVYVKSSVTAPKGKPFIPRETHKGERNFQFDTYKYKIYHPSFPHEPTSDQFFDPVQWEAYYQLGQFMAADVLDLHSRLFLEYQQAHKKNKDISIDDLIACFDQNVNLFAPALADLVAEAEAEEVIVTEGRGLEEAAPKTQKEMPPAVADDLELELGYEM